MTSRRLRPKTIPAWLGVTAALLLMLPGSVFATHFELSRLASQIELISGQLAHELRYTRYYGSVRQRATALEREASQLVDTLQRNSSNSRVRSRFKDVRRGYERLEEAFFTANRRAHDPVLYREISLLSDVFTDLSDRFYYAGVGVTNSVRPIVVPRRGTVIVDSRRGHSFKRDRYERSYVPPRTRSRIVPHRERAVPPVFRGNSGRAIPNREANRDGNREVNRAERRRADPRQSRNIIRGLQAPRYDHRSAVLDRQQRQQAERRQLENLAARNRPAQGRRPSAGRETGQRVQRGRGVVSETDSLNQHE